MNVPPLILATKSVLAGTLLIALGACTGEPSKQFSFKNTYGKVSCSNSWGPMVDAQARGAGTGFHKPKDAPKGHSLTPKEAMKLCNAFLGKSVIGDSAVPPAGSMDPMDQRPGSGA